MWEKCSREEIEQMIRELLEVFGEGCLTNDINGCRMLFNGIEIIDYGQPEGYFKRPKINVVCFMGKSASGKSTLIKKYNGHVVKSFSTRPIRENDPNDIHTHEFVGECFYKNVKGKILDYQGQNYNNFVTLDSFKFGEQNLFAVDPKAYNIMCKLPSLFSVEGVYIMVDEQERLKRLKDRQDGKMYGYERHLSYAHIEDDANVTMVVNGVNMGALSMYKELIKNENQKEESK